MTDIFPKFIIEDGGIVLGKVTYHKELVTDKTKVKGGGWFSYIADKNTFEFYGTSDEFGPASLQDIKAAVEAHKIFTWLGTRSLYEKHNFQYRHGNEITPLKIS